MIASNSAFMSSVRGVSLPYSSAYPTVGTVTNVIRPAFTPCTDWPRSTRSLVLMLSTKLSWMNMLTTLLSLFSEKNVSLEISDLNREDRNSCWRLMRP